MIVVLHLLLGFALGAGSSVVPGPCNLAVITAATRRGLTRALGTAAGAALGDATCAGLGILGLGPVLAGHPSVPPVLQALSGVGLIGYGIAHLRPRRAADAAPTSADGAPGRAGAELARGVAVGLATLLANPGALITWLVVVGSALAGASPLAGWCTVAGIGAGSALWFTMVACVTRYGRSRHDLLARVTRLVSSLLVASGVASLVRAASAWWMT